MKNETLSYDIASSIPLAVAQTWKAEELIPKIRAFQRYHKRNWEQFQHGEFRVVPLEYEQFNWFDHQYTEWFICQMAQVQFQTKEFYKNTKNEVSYDFSCKTAMFADDGEIR